MSFRSTREWEFYHTAKSGVTYYYYVSRDYLVSDKQWDGAYSFTPEKAKSIATAYSIKVDTPTVVLFLEDNILLGMLEKDSIPVDLRNILNMYQSKHVNKSLLDALADGEWLHEPIVVKCQCGSAKCNLPHSTWCPMHQE